MAIGDKVRKAQEAKAAQEAQSNEQVADALIEEFGDTIPPEVGAASGGTVTMTMDQVIALMQANKGGGFDTTALETLLTRVMAANATANANAMQSALNRSNPDYKSRSPFHDEDGKEAIPRAIVYFGPQYTKGKGSPLPRDMYTPHERDLINRFQVGDHKAARGGDWTAECVRNGSTEELYVKVPMTTADQRQNLPSFALILRELLDGENAVNPDKLAERVAELERKLAAAGAAAS